MRLSGDAAIVGFVERPARRKPDAYRFALEDWALLSKAALDDAALDPGLVNGLVTNGIAESARFAPATIAEYLGIEVAFGEAVDLGGASAAAGVWRAAVAIELGLCDVVLVVTPTGNRQHLPRSARKPGPSANYLGASSDVFGSPQSEFEIPYGNLGQNVGYAQIAQRYATEYGYDDRAMAKIAVDQRTNACTTPGAVFRGQPLTVDDVLQSPVIADPLRLYEIVMRCHGGAAVVVAGRDLATRCRRRPVWIKGFGEMVSYKTPTYAPDLLSTPMPAAAARAFAMAGLTAADVDMASLYDCYTITVLMTLEDAGFCPKGSGMSFVAAHDLTYRGDFPLNTAGGQLSYGQAGAAGGMHHVCDAARQIMGRAGHNQIADCDVAFVSGNGGIMSEQVALVLAGD